jgi:plasmid replication initiation protein
MMKNEKNGRLKKSNNNNREHKLIYQHNKLIEARYDLTLQEKRIILYCLQQIPDDFDIESKNSFPTIFIPIRDFCELSNIKFDGNYQKLRDVSKRLRKRTLVIENIGSKDFSVVGWVDSISYEEKKGLIKVDLSRFLMKFLIDLKSNFTSIPLSQTLGLSSVHAIRMFELLKQYQSIGKREIDLITLKKMLGIDDKKLNLYGDLKRRVLQISQRELEEKTDIIFSFEEIKTSRKVTSIQFFIEKNPNFRKKEIESTTNKYKKVLEESRQRIIEQIIDIGFSKANVNKFFNMYDEFTISKALYCVQYQIQKGQVLNPKAMLRTALKEGWASDKFIPKDKKN